MRRRPLSSLRTPLLADEMIEWVAGRCSAFGRSWHLATVHCDAPNLVAIGAIADLPRASRAGRSGAIDPELPLQTANYCIARGSLMLAALSIVLVL